MVLPRTGSAASNPGTSWIEADLFKNERGQSADSNILAVVEGEEGEDMDSKQGPTEFVLEVWICPRNV